MDRARKLPDPAHDDLFWTAVYNTLYYTALAVPIGVVVAMGLALAMNQPAPRGADLPRDPLPPVDHPALALAFIFQILMNPNPGRIQPHPDLASVSRMSTGSAIRPGRNSPSSSSRSLAPGRWLIFLAGLKGIPHSLYEAAKFDGAIVWSRFRNITRR